MFNKKMLLSVLIIGLVSVMAGSTTWAYFQDTEISADNTFTAGTLDLSLTNAPFSIGNIEPGDAGAENQTIQNVGSLAGELDIQLGTIANIESDGSTEFENDTINGEGIGELGGVAEMALWLDWAGNGIFDSGTDITLYPNGTTTTASTYFDTINSYSGADWDAVTIMDSGEDYNFTVQWDFPTGTGIDNTTQGDSVIFDVTFILEQADYD
ncbi:hypothetical protein MSSAC_1125 [Methanosarcina siciliae C2J]|uniref:Uncharacterized protein n=1 Tax=Methanosarcina siciliae C2J TaxID=1434118 RepID=A0A0E3PMM4_9EURY|nr:TasA family protein [Methanosarcina siciliae]AKB35715.1 hypothetical protein MSSAC_1125 [Methanosarcina siciliae C2J]